MVCVALLALVTIGHVTLDIILIQLHQTSDVLILILGVNNLLHVLLELRNDLLLGLRLIVLTHDVKADLHDLALHPAQVLSVCLQVSTLLLKVLLQLQQLVLQIVDLFLFGLQTGLHLLGTVG